jgi:hypothetical protein
MSSIEFTFEGEWRSVMVPKRAAKAVAEALKANGAVRVEIYTQLRSA